MSSKYAMLRWWLIFCSFLIATAVIQHKGLFVALWIADVSKLSFFILAIFLIVSISIGFITKTLMTEDPSSPEHRQHLRYIDACWWISEAMMSIAMMGTLIGFMILVAGAVVLFSGATAALVSSFAGVAGGMSTSLSVTLAGLLVSQLIKLQLVNIEISLDENEKV